MMKSFRSRLALFLTVSLLAGCGGPSLPPQANSDEARTALTSALDAWKKGGSVKELLSQGTPPIYFNDPNCQADMQLVSFKLDDAHTMYGQSVRISATLSIKRKDGPLEEKKTKYLVDTAPAIVIVPG